MQNVKILSFFHCANYDIVSQNIQIITLNIKSVGILEVRH